MTQDEYFDKFGELTARIVKALPLIAKYQTTAEQNIRGTYHMVSIGHGYGESMRIHYYISTGEQKVTCTYDIPRKAIEEHSFEGIIHSVLCKLELLKEAHHMRPSVDKLDIP